MRSILCLVQSSLSSTKFISEIYEEEKENEFRKECQLLHSDPSDPSVSIANGSVSQGIIVYAAPSAPQPPGLAARLVPAAPA